MLADLCSDDLPAAIDTDVCIVGAGPVGIALAVDLSRRGLDVVLLESGGRALEPALQDLVRSANVGRNHNGINIGRHRGFGGTSTRWGGQILPFARVDFERRDWVPGSGWPISFDDLGPYYAKALEIEGLGRSLREDREVWSAIGVAEPDFGAALGAHFSRWCPEPDFARLHGREVERSAKLRCVLHATVTALARTGERIDSALGRTLGGRSVRVRARRFVFCVGAIETARLLLHPMEDGTPPPWLERTNALGRHFQDHPTFDCADVRPRDSAALHRLMDMVYLKGQKYQPRLYLGAARQAQERTLNVGGLLSFKSEISRQVLHQVRLAARTFVRGRLSAGAIAGALRTGISAGPLIARQAWRYAVQGRAFNPSDRGCRLLAFVEQPPDPDSRVSLSHDADALGMRRAQLDWRVGASEVAAVETFARSVKHAFETAGLADVEIDAAVAARDPGVAHTCWDNFHDMGTARMAEGPDRGVVDPSLRMFGTVNAYVCSSAVFPTGSFSNPTHTAIALALRLADHLHERGHT